MKKNNDSIGCGLVILGFCIGLTFAPEIFSVILAGLFIIALISMSE